MNNKITNPLLKQLISEIASKANEGRITNINWGVIEESKKKKIKEADEKKDETPDKAASDLPPSNEKDSKAPAKPEAAPEKDKAPADKPTPEVDASQPEAPAKPEAPAEPKADADTKSDDVENAKKDAAKKQAELEKAKAEEDQAEQELKQHSYVKLKSSGGLQFLLGKLLNTAFKTNTIDALATEMTQKLKITTTEDASSFEEDMALYKNIPGMVDLISTIKTIATEQPKQPAEETPEK